MKSFNPEYIVSIEVAKAKPNTWFEYVPEWRIFGIKIFGEHIRSCFGDRMPINELPELLFLENGIVYEKPRVTLNFVNGESQTYTFDTSFDAITFAQKFKPNPEKWIE